MNKESNAPHSKEQQGTNERRLAWDWTRWPRVPEAVTAGAILEQTVPAYEHLFRPMGRALLLQSNAAGVVAAARESLGRFSGPSPEGEPLLLRLFVHDAEPACAHESGRQPIVFRTHGHLLYITAGSANTAVADLLSGQAFGFVTAEMAADGPYLRYAFIESLAYSLLTATGGLVSFHAACVVKDGRGLVLGGDAGAGKSTLAYACARRGYQILAEDAVFVDPRPDGARLWGIPWRLHLLPDAKRFFPELRAEEPHLQINGEWKLEVDVERYCPGATTAQAAPGLVILLDRGEPGGPVRFEPVAPEEVRRQFRSIWPWWVGWRPQMDEAVDGFLAGRTYRLWTNGSPGEAVGALDDLWAAAGLGVA